MCTFFVLLLLSVQPIARLHAQELIFRRRKIDHGWILFRTNWAASTDRIGDRRCTFDDYEESGNVPSQYPLGSTSSL